MKLVVTTYDGKTIATFKNAEDLDYVDYSAELDEAIPNAVRAEGKHLPAWLSRHASRQ